MLFVGFLEGLVLFDSVLSVFTSFLHSQTLENALDPLVVQLIIERMNETLWGIYED